MSGQEKNSEKSTKTPAPADALVSAADVGLAGGSSKNAAYTSKEQQVILKQMRIGTDPTSLGLHSTVIEMGTGPAEALSSNQAPDIDKIKPPAVALDPFLFGTVKPEDVESGRAKTTFVGPHRFQETKPGILSCGSAADIEKFEGWLNSKIPPDGKAETNDKRTSLILQIALADAARLTKNPADQTTEAYRNLNALRHLMEEETPGKGYELDSGIANAEHFLETAHRVAGKPFDKDSDDGRLLRGKYSAGTWEFISGTYNQLKKHGIISGSDAENQHKWESSGIAYGEKVYDATDMYSKTISSWNK